MRMNLRNPYLAWRFDDVIYLLMKSLRHGLDHIITPLASILPAHWFRARHMICLSFARRRPCDSASVCRALVATTRRAVPRRPLRVRG